MSSESAKNRCRVMRLQSFPEEWVISRLAPSGVRAYRPDRAHLAGRIENFLLLGDLDADLHGGTDQTGGIAQETIALRRAPFSIGHYPDAQFLARLLHELGEQDAAHHLRQHEERGQ